MEFCMLIENPLIVRSDIFRSQKKIKIIKDLVLYLNLAKVIIFHHNVQLNYIYIHEISVLIIV